MLLITMVRAARRPFPLVVALASATVLLTAQTPPHRMVVRGGTLIDGTGAAPRPNSVILIEGDRIRQVDAPAADTAGATVIDVKEPDRGPLGCADPEVWRRVREAVPPGVPVSVALGELRDWGDRPLPPPGSFEGIAFTS